MSVVDLHCLAVGEGIPLVLLHAFPLNATMWSEQRATLREHAQVLTPDQRGFGGTRLGEDDPSLDHAADDLAALLDVRGLERVVLGGLSMGGYVAMAFWRRHPDRVRALVLADTKAGADAEPAVANRHRLADAVEEAQSCALLVDELVPKLLGATTHRERPAILGRVSAFVRSAPPAAVAWAQRAMAARPDSMETLASVTVPTLVVVGEEDEVSPPADAAAMVAAIPDARLVLLPGAGHLTAMETPEAFSAAVADFLATLTG